MQVSPPLHHGAPSKTQMVSSSGVVFIDSTRTTDVQLSGVIFEVVMQEEAATHDDCWACLCVTDCCTTPLLFPRLVGLLLGCFSSQQDASVSQGRIYSDNCTCCHTETEVADPTFYLAQSQCIDTGPTSPNTPGAWQRIHWDAILSHWYDLTRKNPHSASGNRTPDLPLTRRTPQPLGQGGGCSHGTTTTVTHTPSCRTLPLPAPICPPPPPPPPQTILVPLQTPPPPSTTIMVAAITV